MKSFSNKIFSILVIPLLAISGCMAAKPLDHYKLETISSISVIRKPTPNLKIISFTRAVLGSSVVFLFMGPGGAALAVEGGRMAGKEDNKIPIYDFGQLVTEKFTERLQKEVANWPQMEIEKEPILKSPQSNKPTLEFRFSRFDLVYLGAYQGNGLVCDTSALLKDDKGNTLWKKNYFYSSAKFNRGREMDEFIDNNGKLLNKEITFAVEQTVKDFVAHIKSRKN